jgi:hypothetical protein
VGFGFGFGFGLWSLVVIWHLVFNNIRNWQLASSKRHNNPQPQRTTAAHGDGRRQYKFKQQRQRNARSASSSWGRIFASWWRF